MNRRSAYGSLRKYFGYRKELENTPQSKVSLYNKMKGIVKLFTRSFVYKKRSMLEGREKDAKKEDP